MRLFRNRVRGMIVLLVCGALCGCRHRSVIVSLSAKSKTPNAFLAPPVPANLQPMRPSDLPAVLTNAAPPVAEEVRPKRRAKRPPPVVAANVTPPAPMPETPPAETAKLGELASGGTANPQQQQEIAGKIAAVEKRVSDLPAALVDRQQKQISQVRLFLREASDALKGGDVEGAKILATKADLLVDDVQK